jgi:cell division protein FtsZ
MGAVIDEDMAGRVEVCVIGTSDMGARGLPARRTVSQAARAKMTLPGAEGRHELSSTTSSATGLNSGTTAEQSTARIGELKLVHMQKPAQDEFGFGEMESRGHFEKTDRNLFDGQDLDVPTYLRRGIKVSI